uniref:Uncharacterized protein n=1 Tax=Clandestinovirus TaxID=2831644 RepID=A0A8F8KMB4_9VIRU|nr:hypothetical protein KOM_12_509 [Clandestinovirus]
MDTQQKVDALLRTKANPDEQVEILKEIVVRQAMEYELLLAQTGQTSGGVKRKSTSSSRPSIKRRKVESAIENDAPVISAPDDDEELPELAERSSTGPTGSLQGTENMTKFHDNFEREKQRGTGGKLPKPGQISRAEEERLEKKMKRDGGDYEQYGVETTHIAPSKTNVPRGSALDGSIRGGQNSHGGHPVSHDREGRSQMQSDSHKKTRRSTSKSREEDEEPSETLTVFGQEIDREVLENTPVLDPGSNKLNTGFRLVEKVAGESGKDIVSSIGSKGGRHSHDNDNVSN